MKSSPDVGSASTLSLRVTFKPSLTPPGPDGIGERGPELHVFCSAEPRSVRILGPREADRSVPVEIPLDPGPIRTDDQICFQAYAYGRGDDCECLNQIGAAYVGVWHLARAGRVELRLLKAQVRDICKGTVEVVLVRPDREALRLGHDLRAVRAAPAGWVRRHEERSRAPLFPGGRFEDRPRSDDPHFYDAARRGATLLPTIPFVQEVQIPPYVTESGSIPGAAYYLLADARSDPAGASDEYQKHVLRIVLADRGLAEGDFVAMATGAAGREALRDAATVLAEWATADVTALPYITDLAYRSNPRRTELIESFDEVRIRRCGDCEDFTSGILRNLAELAAVAPHEDPALAALASLARRFVACACLSVVTFNNVKNAASAAKGGGGGGGGEAGADRDALDSFQAHMMGLLVPRGRMRTMLRRAGERADAPPELLDALVPEDPEDEDLPVLVLEGTGRAAPDVASPKSRAPRAGPDEPLARVRGIAPYVGSREPLERWEPWVPADGEDGRANWPPPASRLTGFYRAAVHLYVPEFYRYGRRGTYVACYVCRPGGDPLRRWCYGVQFEDFLYGAFHVGLHALSPLTEEEHRLSVDVLRRCEPVPRPRPPSDPAGAPPGWSELAEGARRLGDGDPRPAPSPTAIGLRPHRPQVGARPVPEPHRPRVHGPVLGARYLVPSGAMSRELAAEILRAAGKRPLDVRLQRFTDEVCAVTVRVGPPPTGG